MWWRYEAVDPYLGGAGGEHTELRAMLIGRFTRLVAHAGTDRVTLVRAVQHLVRELDLSGLLEGDATTLQLFIVVDDGVFEHAASIQGDTIQWNVDTWVFAFTARWSGNPAAWPLL